MKYFVKICWFIVLFAGSVFFFGNKMVERLSDEYVSTTKAGTSELPVISLRSDGVTVNSLYGYAAELDPLIVRENFVTLESDNVIDLLINERATDVRKLLYEVFDTETGEKLTDGQISAFDYTDKTKNARLKLDLETQQGREYSAEVTLITSESKRVHYYFRFKQYDEAYFAEKVAYMLEFSKACRDKNIDYVIPFLESTYRGEGTDYAHVDIKDSYQMVCWGKLEPEVVGDIKVTINEIYKYIAVGTLKYTVQMETASGDEEYVITERFRISLGGDYVYLLNYERDMNAVFDPKLISLSQAQLKLGITPDTQPDMAWTKDNSMFCFVRNNTVWYYNIPENTLFSVYSMNTGYVWPSEVCPEHDLRILRMDDNGDVTFMVSGYMNNGEYEGKTGILLYVYYRSENRIKELLYIPVAETNQHIRQEIGAFSYMNAQDVFFFMAYGMIYSYNMTTGELTGLTAQKVSGDVVFCRDLSYVAWQEEGNVSDIFILYLENNARRTLHVDGDKLIKLFGYIGDNMITGYGSLSDYAAYSDGSVYYPISELKILGEHEEVLKNYHVPGYYITGVSATDTAIRLQRVVKTDDGQNVYDEAPDDYILIYEEDQNRSFSVDVRATESMLTEYYLSLPSTFKADTVPKQTVSDVTVIAENTLVRVQALETQDEHYEVYSFGSIIGIKDDPTEAIALADTDEAVGTVVDRRGRIFWERGVQNKNDDLKEETVTKALELTDSVIDAFLNLNHATLPEMFYFVYKDIPVYSMLEDGSIILVTGYTQNQVTYTVLSTRKSYTIRINTLEEKLEKGGNVFRVMR
ncbi:MAG: hypothetical protein J6Z46_10135 [Lachnospiraceae bacterium]|nr:hypothetical protein [Lachnospiraceae bacterium]